MTGNVDTYLSAGATLQPVRLRALLALELPTAQATLNQDDMLGTGGLVI